MESRPVERHQVSFEFRWLSGELICHRALPEHRECRLLRRIAIDAGAVRYTDTFDVAVDGTFVRDEDVRTIAEALAGVDAERHLEIGVVGQIEEALALLEASAHVRTATRFGDRLLATLVPEAAVAAVSSELVEAGQKLIHLSLREVDLEDVYLSLTDKGDPHRLGGTDPACS